MPAYDRPSNQALNAKASACAKYLAPNFESKAEMTAPERNVVGVGIGPKLKNGKVVTPESIRFYVQKKEKETSNIPTGHMLPDEIEGRATDVIAVGRFRSGCGHNGAPTPGVIQPGTSCGVRVGGNGESATGTVGAIVGKGDRRFFLSSAHVLARPHGILGSPILHPGPPELPELADDVRQGHDHVHEENVALGQDLPRESDFRRARLHDFEVLSLSGMNQMDAAIAEILSPDYDPRILDDDKMVSRPLTRTIPFPPMKDMRVSKMGYGTRLTKGHVVDPDATVRVEFAAGSMQFEHQLLIQGDSDDPFAWEGDSGALVFTEFTWQGGIKELMAVGLLFAYSLPEVTDKPPESYCVATDINRILNRFEVELVTV